MPYRQSRRSLAPLTNKEEYIMSVIIIIIIIIIIIVIVIIIMSMIGTTPITKYDWNYRYF